MKPLRALINKNNIKRAVQYLSEVKNFTTSDKDFIPGRIVVIDNIPYIIISRETLDEGNFFNKEYLTATEDYKRSKTFFLKPAQSRSGYHFWASNYWNGATPANISNMYNSLIDTTKILTIEDLKTVYDSMFKGLEQISASKIFHD